MNPATAVDGMFWFLAFLFSTTVHEAAHAWAAKRGGDETAYLGGQVSLSPLPHIKREPIGMLIVPLLTAFTQGWALGWASAPYDPRWAERHPNRAAWMAAAGPAGNFLLAVIAWALMKGGLMIGWFNAAPTRVNYSHLVLPIDPSNAYLSFAAQGLSVMVMLNVFLGTFNLLPLPPMDGASAVELLLPDSFAEKFRKTVRTPQFSLVGLLLAWKVFPYVTPSIFGLVIKSVYPQLTFH